MLLSLKLNAEKITAAVQQPKNAIATRNLINKKREFSSTVRIFLFSVVKKKHEVPQRQ